MFRSLESYEKHSKLTDVQCRPETEVAGVAPVRLLHSAIWYVFRAIILASIVVLWWVVWRNHAR